MPKGAVKARPAAKKAVKPAKKLAPVPPNMAWVSVYLAVKDAARAVDFYEKAFGFKRGLSIPGKDGKVMHAEMVYKDCMIMMGPECDVDGMKWKAPVSATGDATTVTYYVYCEDVDVLCERARKAGGRVVREPADQFYGDRNCTIVDPDGHSWGFATRVKEFDPKDAPANCG